MECCNSVVAITEIPAGARSAPFDLAGVGVKLAKERGTLQVQILCKSSLIKSLGFKCLCE